METEKKRREQKKLLIALLHVSYDIFFSIFIPFHCSMLKRYIRSLSLYIGLNVSIERVCDAAIQANPSAQT